MTEQTSTNKELMHRMYAEMWNKGDPARAADFFAQPEGVERFVSRFLAAFTDLQHTVEEMIAEGDRVAVRFSASGTHTGRWLDFEPTNRSIQYSGLTLARIAGDRIIEHHTWWDKAGVDRAVKGG